MPLFLSIVLDGVGIGAQDDADLYGDVGSNTLVHVCEYAAPGLPNLAALGLGCIAPLPNVACTATPAADFGIMREQSPGKDSTTGHWELAGVHLERPFPTYPDGFPVALVQRFAREARVTGVLGNKAASGTQIIQDLGGLHVATGQPIVYTSADSVFQVAAHVDTIPLERLYDICRIARDRVCVGEHAVGRVIARPFNGASGAFTRITAARKDFAILPEDTPLQVRLQEAGVRTVSIGKVSDLFGGVGFDETRKTKSNEDGVAQIRTLLADYDGETPTFVWVNLIDFDQEFGHRNDVDGFAQALEQFDEALPEMLDLMPHKGMLLITADHGNDPTFPGTDHTREHVPLLVFGAGGGRDLGQRSTFADHAATVGAYFSVHTPTGTSFL